jgi:malonyl-CoA decarboxylase
MISASGLLQGVWESIASRRRASRKGIAASNPLVSMCRELLTERGEASGTALALEIAARYRGLTVPERESFFLSLLDADFLPDPQIVIAAAERYRIRPDSGTLGALFAVAEPRRQELFRRINQAPGGTEAVVMMRTDLLKILPAHPALKSVDADMHHLLASWFNRGFLHVDRIHWGTPARVLEKLIEYEAVHEIDGWDDLRRRLADDRRCFAFFHPALPQQPLIFIEVALTRGIAASVQNLLDRSCEPIAVARADTAIFYSITNCLEGLRGVSFGNFLIKQVVTELKAENLNLRTFATLSPMPGFRAWWNSLSESRKAELSTAGERQAISALEGIDWQQNPALITGVEPALLRLGAHYLLCEHKGERALDPVAAFHLGHGAVVEKIHALGDRSAKGMSRSFGLMVNYSYRLSHLERNHEAYVKQGRIAASSEVKSLLKSEQSRGPISNRFRQ